MASQTIPVSACMKVIEAATQSCRPATLALATVGPTPAQPNWDAMATSFASLSNAFAWGSLILTLLTIFAGFTWGKIVTAGAEKEARKMAEAEVKRWLNDEALPMIMRQANEFLQTFRGEGPISDDALAELVAALGNDGKEDGNGKK